MITQTELKEILNYDPDTGIFTWINPVKKTMINCVAGSLTVQGYKVITIKRKNYAAHRLAWLYMNGKFPNKFIDHINTIKSDNKLSNLRDVSRIENGQNQIKAHKNNKSGLLGVTWYANTSSWVAKIKNNNKLIHLGYFKNPELAHQVYLKAKREIHLGCTI
jgi:hypothetical protein